MKDSIFSDGTFIPKGTRIGVPNQSLQHEKKFYENPNVFQPFRFAEMHKEGNGESRVQLVSTSIEYLEFGHGKHAWCDAFCLSAFHLEISGRLFSL